MASRRRGLGPNLQNMRYRPDIDGLRAVAVAAVMLFHLGIPGVSGGYVGVDVFFVISGYLIGDIIARELSEGRFSFVEFFTRRVRRLLPASFVMFLVVAAASVLIIAPAETDNLGRTLASASVYASNIYFWRTADYFAAPSELDPLLHTWSLAIEEQFYLVTPALLYLIWRKPALIKKSVLWGVALVSFLLSWWGATNMPTSTFFLLPARYWELMSGVLLAVSSLPRVRTAGMANALGAAGLLMILGSASMFDAETPFPGSAAALPVFGTVALILAGQHQGGLTTRLLSGPAPVWVGRRSYSLYLWHWPALVFARHLALRPLDIWETTSVLLLSFALAEASYQFIERPFRSAPQFTSGVAFKAAVGSAAVCVLIASAFVLTNGMRFRYPHLATLDNTQARPFARRPTCQVDTRVADQRWDADNCRFGSGPGPRMLLWGDSLAGHYRDGLLGAGPDVNAEVLLYTTTVCPPILGYHTNARPYCEQFNERALEIVAREKIDIVVLAARWESVQRRLGDLSLVKGTVEKLIETGAQVMVLGQTPVLPLSAESLFARVGRDATGAGSVTTSIHVKPNAALRELLPASVQFLDPADFFCQGSRCRYMEDDRLLFNDNVHFSRAGSEKAVRRYFSRQIQARVQH